LSLCSSNQGLPGTIAFGARRCDKGAMLSFFRSLTVRLRPLAAFGVLLLLGSPSLGQVFQTVAPQAMLYDVQSRSVLFEANADTPFAPASLVKVMTAAVVFEELRQGRLRLEDEMVVSENAWRRGGAASGGSTMFAVPNSRIKVQDLIQGLLIHSGNDAAIILAEGIAGTEDAFVRVMNERARALGLNRTTFRNSTGFGHPEQRVTAADMVKLAVHVIETYPDYYRFFGQREFTWNRVRQQNRNPLLAMDIGADGMKTGNIEESGFGLVASAVQNGQRLVLVVGGLKTARDRALEARKLLDWGFRSFEARDIYDVDEVIGEVAVFGGEKRTVNVTAGSAVRMLVPRGQSDRLRGRITYSGPLSAPVAKGQEVGRLRIERGAARAIDIPVFAAEDVPAGPLAARARDAALELMTGWMRRLWPRARET
jgi:serine-type D-Ala-D-Ala carboxypeptidase (penicillin-binding protein 5/6)